MSESFKISVVCPVCQTRVEAEITADLWGFISINSPSCVEVTAPSEISVHMNSHTNTPEYRSRLMAFYDNAARMAKSWRENFPDLVKEAEAREAHPAGKRS
jgi:hypothetical protein